MGDATITGPWQQVVCADCGREYRCTPNDDHYLRAGDPEGSPRVCFACLTADIGRPDGCTCGPPDDAWNCAVHDEDPDLTTDNGRPS